MHCVFLLQSCYRLGDCTIDLVKALQKTNKNPTALNVHID